MDLKPEITGCIGCIGCMPIVAGWCYQPNLVAILSPFPPFPLSPAAPCCLLAKLPQSSPLKPGMSWWLSAMVIAMLHLEDECLPKHMPWTSDWRWFIQFIQPTYLKQKGWFIIYSLGYSFGKMIFWCSDSYCQKAIVLERFSWSLTAEAGILFLTLNQTSGSEVPVPFPSIEMVIVARL